MGVMRNMVDPVIFINYLLTNRPIGPIYNPSKGQWCPPQDGETIMAEVSKIEFETFVSTNCPAHVVREPRIEMDSPYKYECFDNEKGEEVAFIAWQNGEATYNLCEAA
jgi:hypothetical protein